MVASLHEYASAASGGRGHRARAERARYRRALARLGGSEVIDVRLTSPPILPLRERFSRGLDAPICLTWELTYACNLACVHCLSSSGRRDPDELTPAEARAIVDELAAMQVFYVNMGGGEPMLRPDFFDLLAYAVERRVGVKFSTNGTR